MESGARTMGIYDRGGGWKVGRERWGYMTAEEGGKCGEKDGYRAPRRRVESGARKMGIEHRGGGWKLGRERWG